jgi:hypothetical protein
MAFSEEIEASFVWTPAPSFASESEASFDFTPGHAFGEEIEATFEWVGSWFGPVFHHVTSVGASHNIGPVSDARVSDPLELTTALGPVSDTTIGHSIVESVGPTFDHRIVLIPLTTVGAVSDRFLSASGFTIHGPVFDHAVGAIFGGIPANGPISDKHLSKGVESCGPIFDHIIAAPPPMLSVLSPETAAPPTPPRNKLDPMEIDFKSPGVFNLERHPDGRVTGFKY